MAPVRPQGENATNTGSSSGNPNGVVKRRNRIPLSCESCRSRKLKCDRQKPCQNCKARDQGNNCVYAADEGKANRGGHLLNLSNDMGDRVQKLEALVNSMLTAQQASAAAGISSNGSQVTSTPSTTGAAPVGESNVFSNVDTALQHSGPYAAMVAAGDGRQFLGPTNWEAVLRDITAIRESIEESSYRLRAPMLVDNDKPAMLRGLPPVATKAELIQTLPTKSLADRLVVRFWDYQHPSMPMILHRQTFKAHLDESYHNLESTSFSRLAIFFTIFAMALQSYENHGPEPPDLRGYIPDLANNYRQSAASCLWAADISYPGQESLVAFQLYWVCEFYRCPKAASGLWMLHAMVVRKAFTMGYHRDPSTFPEISVFEGEMRRRSWHVLCQADLLLSFHLGVPGMIDYGQTDVQSPRSLYEDSLYENMTELPAERPRTEKTPVTYMISKKRLFQVFQMVITAINSIYPPSDEEILNLNDQLTAAYNDIYPHLREETVGETKFHRMQRLNIACTYHKAICVLNRRSLFLNGRTSTQEQSRDLCIKSALFLLSIQESMHVAEERWHDLVYACNDFLLASVLVCMILYTFKKYAKPDSNMFDLPSEAEESIYRSTLSRAKEIWASSIDLVPEAHKACGIIDATLYQTAAQKESIGADSVDSAVFSALSAGSLSTPDYVPIYSSIDFDKFDWDSWDKMISTSTFDAQAATADQMLQGNIFGPIGV